MPDGTPVLAYGAVRGRPIAWGSNFLFLILAWHLSREFLLVLNQVRDFCFFFWKKKNG